MIIKYIVEIKENIVAVKKNPSGTPGKGKNQNGHLENAWHLFFIVEESIP